MKQEQRTTKILKLEDLRLGYLVHGSEYCTASKIKDLY